MIVPDLVRRMGSTSAFMTQLGLQVTGGRKGTITVLRRQLDKLFCAAISWSYRAATDTASRPSCSRSGPMSCGGIQGGRSRG